MPWLLQNHNSFQPRSDRRLVRLLLDSALSAHRWTGTPYGRQEKFLHPAYVPYGGMFLEMKIFKNPNRKVVFHPNFFFRNHHFLVISLTEVSRGPIVCREECIYKCIRICTTKWWLLKIVFGWKMTLGVRFFGFFTSKNMPPYGTCAGCKKNFDTSMQGVWY